MSIKGDKGGQFFLIAAVVIIVVIVSVVTISNYTQKKDVVKLYDFGEELGIESQNVLDYGTYSELNSEQMQTLMENFIKNYVDYIGNDKNIYFIFGNKYKVNIVGYQEVSEESVCINVNPTGQKCESGTCSAGTGSRCSQAQVECGLKCCSAGQKCESGVCVSGSSCSATEVQCGSACCTACTPYLAIGETEGFSLTGGEEISRVVIRIADVDYEFKLKSGENFYFVIWQSIGGEKHVITG